MKICKYCQAQCPDDHKYCDYCGSPFEIENPYQGFNPNQGPSPYQAYPYYGAQQKKKAGLPAWAIVLIIVGTLVLVPLIYFIALFVLACNVGVFGTSTPSVTYSKSNDYFDLYETEVEWTEDSSYVGVSYAPNNYEDTGAMAMHFTITDWDEEACTMTLQIDRWIVAFSDLAHSEPVTISLAFSEEDGVYTTEESTYPVWVEDEGGLSGTDGYYMDVPFYLVLEDGEVTVYTNLYDKWVEEAYVTTSIEALTYHLPDSANMLVADDDASIYAPLQGAFTNDYYATNVVVDICASGSYTAEGQTTITAAVALEDLTPKYNLSGEITGYTVTIDYLVCDEMDNADWSSYGPNLNLAVFDRTTGQEFGYEDTTTVTLGDASYEIEFVSTSSVSYSDVCYWRCQKIVEIPVGYTNLAVAIGSYTEADYDAQDSFSGLMDGYPGYQGLVYFDLSAELAAEIAALEE